MAEADKSTHVTRREFYSALSLLWLYIMVVIGDLLKSDPSFSKWILWGGPLLLWLTYSGLTIRTLVVKKQPDKPA
jgi:hypothetical protein